MIADRRPYQIVTRPEILGLLSRIYENHSLLTIKLDDQPQTFSSNVLGINTRKNLFLIDDLFPAPFEELERKTELYCSTRLDGISINFNCQLKTTSEVDGNRLHQLHMPPLIHYHQRRRHYRVPLNWTGGVVSGSLHGRNFYANISDISVSGISATLEMGELHDIHPGMCIKGNSLSIPNYETMPMDIKVRTIRTGPIYGQTIIGMEMLHPDQFQIKQMQRLIAELDREACQIRFLKDEITRIRETARLKQAS